MAPAQAPQAQRAQERPLPEQGPSLLVGVDDELEPGEAGRRHLGVQPQPVGVLDPLDHVIRAAAWTVRCGGSGRQIGQTAP
jgi:hypothetical protein